MQFNSILHVDLPSLNCCVAAYANSIASAYTCIASIPALRECMRMES